MKSNVVISKNYENKPLDYANEGANECSVAKWRGHYGGIFGTLELCVGGRVWRGRGSGCLLDGHDRGLCWLNEIAEWWMNLVENLIGNCKFMATLLESLLSIL